ncbi:MAG: helix-turn-helix domain-containing protein, partial [Deltaproteobacteria bacterium]
VELPPLRRRKEDIPLLVDQCIQRFNRLQQRTVQGIATEALSLLMAHDWPGNIRELENAIEHAFILCNSGRIGLSHLPEALTARCATTDSDSDMRSAHNTLDVQSILAALQRNAFSRLAAAKELGIHKTTLFRKMKKLNISLPDQDGRSEKKP